MAVLKNEQLLRPVKCKWNLQILEEPDVVGIATNGKSCFFVYRTDERGQIAWRKVFTSFNVAHAYARKMYVGLQSATGEPISTRRITPSNSSNELVTKDLRTVFVADKKIRPSMPTADLVDVVKGYCVVNRKPRYSGIRKKGVRQDHNNEQKRIKVVHTLKKKG